MTRRKKTDKLNDKYVINGGPGETQYAPAAKIDPIDLRSMFRNLPEEEQLAVINFFNLHNAAIWIYNKLSAPAMEYVELSINLSQEKIK